MKVIFQCLQTSVLNSGSGLILSIFDWFWSGPMRFPPPGGGPGTPDIIE